MPENGVGDFLLSLIKQPIDTKLHLYLIGCIFNGRPVLILLSHESEI